MRNRLQPVHLLSEYGEFCLKNYPEKSSQKFGSTIDFRSTYDLDSKNNTRFLDRHSTEKRYNQPFLIRTTEAIKNYSTDNSTEEKN